MQRLRINCVCARDCDAGYRYTFHMNVYIRQSTVYKKLCPVICLPCVAFLLPVVLFFASNSNEAMKYNDYTIARVKIVLFSEQKRILYENL